MINHIIVKHNDREYEYYRDLLLWEVGDVRVGVPAPPTTDDEDPTVEDLDAPF